MKISCPYCGQHFEVEEEFAGQSVECSSCGKLFTISAPEPTKRCPMCGEEILAVAKKCKHCGEYLDEFNRPIQRKSRTAYVLFCLFLGGIGAHNFYIGQIWRGMVKIAASILGFAFISQATTSNHTIVIWGGVLIFFNALWAIMELFPDPNDAESMKKASLWQCIVLGISLLYVVFIICLPF